MRVVIQRVSEASVTIEGSVYSSIERGLLVLVGICEQDSDEDIEWLCNKIVNLRVFADENDVMNLSVKDINGEILAVSQFTLMAMTKRGNRPSYINAASPEIAIPLYERFVKTLSDRLERNIPTGIFGADMKVAMINDGPVTICIDTKNRE